MAKNKDDDILLLYVVFTGFVYCAHIERKYKDSNRKFLHSVLIGNAPVPDQTGKQPDSIRSIFGIGDGEFLTERLIGYYFEEIKKPRPDNVPEIKLRDLQIRVLTKQLELMNRTTDDDEPWKNGNSYDD